MFYDSWGNEYETKTKAIEGIYNLFRKSEDYWESIGENMNIDNEIMCWIIENHKDSFKKHFAKRIKKAEDEWCEYYIEELEEDYF
jgi:hypothetical protein